MKKLGIIIFSLLYFITSFAAFNTYNNQAELAPNLNTPSQINLHPAMHAFIIGQQQRQMIKQQQLQMQINHQQLQQQKLQIEQNNSNSR